MSGMSYTTLLPSLTWTSMPFAAGQLSLRAVRIASAVVLLFEIAIWTVLELIFWVPIVRLHPLPVTVVAGHRFAGELCSATGSGSTFHVSLLKPRLSSFAFLIVTKYVLWKSHLVSAGLEIK